jgi:hypothetical protein
MISPDEFERLRLESESIREESRSARLLSEEIRREALEERNDRRRSKGLPEEPVDTLKT